METISINNYIFDKPLASENSGFSKWGIGVRDGKKYFVKEFLSPVYPMEDAFFSDEARRSKIKLCKEFVAKKQKLYYAIREINDGHLVAVEQFFRTGSKYYISTEACKQPFVSIQTINKAPFIDRLLLCSSAAHAFAMLHKRHIVHSDVKPENILVTIEGGFRPHIIDFDCSFFENEPPSGEDDLHGDFVYLSPEGFLHMAGEATKLTCKMDVFALGLLFHQYLTGDFPGFNKKEYQYAYESVLDGQALSTSLPNTYCQTLIDDMLKKQPEDRPDMNFVFQKLSYFLKYLIDRI